jgi:hypothetical protein
MKYCAKELVIIVCDMIEYVCLSKDYKIIILPHD